MPDLPLSPKSHRDELKEGGSVTTHGNIGERPQHLGTGVSVASCAVHALHMHWQEARERLRPSRPSTSWSGAPAGVGAAEGEAFF